MRIFFQLYNISENFKVTSASEFGGKCITLVSGFKHSGTWPTWEQFSTKIAAEFDVNVHRGLMKSLLLLRQRGSVEEYKIQFYQLVYNIRLYELQISDTFLVTRFIMGLKEELRAAVEIQLPEIVSCAVSYALVQEGLQSSARGVKPAIPRALATKLIAARRIVEGKATKGIHASQWVVVTTVGEIRA